MKIIVNENDLDFNLEEAIKEHVRARIALKEGAVLVLTELTDGDWEVNIGVNITTDAQAAAHFGTEAPKERRKPGPKPKAVQVPEQVEEPASEAPSASTVEAQPVEALPGPDKIIQSGLFGKKPAAEPTLTAAGKPITTMPMLKEQMAQEAAKRSISDNPEDRGEQEADDDTKPDFLRDSFGTSTNPFQSDDDEEEEVIEPEREEIEAPVQKPAVTTEAPTGAPVTKSLFGNLPK